MGHFLSYFCNRHGFYKEYKAGVPQPGAQLPEVTPWLKQAAQFPVLVTTAEEIRKPAANKMHLPQVSATNTERCATGKASPRAAGTRSLLGAAAHRLDVLRPAESSLALVFTPNITSEYSRLAIKFSPSNTEKTQRLAEHLKQPDPTEPCKSATTNSLSHKCCRRGQLIQILSN